MHRLWKRRDRARARGVKARFSSGWRVVPKSHRPRTSHPIFAESRDFHTPACVRLSFHPSFMPFLRLTYRQEHRSIRLRCNARPRFHHVGCTVFLGCLVPTRAPCRREADGVSSPQGRAQVVVAHVRRDGLAIARTWALPRRFARGTQVGRRCGRS